MNYVAYDPTTGFIRQKGFTQPGHTPSVMFAEILEVDLDTFHAISNTSEWSVQMIDGAPALVNSPLLPQAKALRLAAMKEARDAAVFGTLVWNGMGFDADQVSQTRLMGNAMKAEKPDYEPQPWRLADNSWTVLTAADSIAVWNALGEHIKAQFARFAVVEALINAAQDVASIEAVQWHE